MRVHFHTICWNDRRMLDFFFRHYEPWVDRFFFLDDGSTDGTRELLEARNDVELGRLERVDPDSWVASALHVYDHGWKRSIGRADWVVVGNVDEHLHHPRMTDYLARMLAAGVTAIPSLGYQMIAERFPPAGSLLRRECPIGAPWRNMSKLGIFRPDQITETRFEAGRHKASFQGNVVFPDRDEVVNLHFKYLGVAETHSRHEAQGARLGKTDRANRWGLEYFWSREELEAEFERFRAAAIDVASARHHEEHPEPRWWRVPV